MSEDKKGKVTVQKKPAGSENSDNEVTAGSATSRRSFLKFGAIGAGAAAAGAAGVTIVRRMDGIPAVVNSLSTRGEHRRTA